MLELTQSCLARTPTPIPPGTPPDGTDLEVSRPEIPDFQEMNAPANHRYGCADLLEWLAHSAAPPLAETYYSLDPAEYNELFDEELEKVIQRTQDPAHRQALEGMRGFGWISYVAASVRNAGSATTGRDRSSPRCGGQALDGRFFRGFDERASGPMDLRFKRSVGNAIKNLIEKERNRKHYIPTVRSSRRSRPAV